MYAYVDDGQNQGTYVVVDEYGERLTNIGLPLDAGYYPQPADHWAYLDRSPLVYSPDDDDVPF